MDFQWFDILKISQLPEQDAGNATGMAADWKSLSLQYVAHIKIDSNKKEYLIRVDAIPLLYELIMASLSLGMRKDVGFQIGEGWWLTSESVSERRLRLRFEFAVGGDIDSLGEYELTVEELVLFLATKISTLVDLLNKNRVDLISCLKKFPVHSYQR